MIPGESDEGEGDKPEGLFCAGNEWAKMQHTQLLRITRNSYWKNLKQQRVKFEPIILRKYVRIRMKKLSGLHFN